MYHQFSHESWGTFYGITRTHVEHLQKVLKKLKDAKLYANPEKCLWFTISVHYLGHEIFSEGIRVSKEKIKAIEDWPAPRNIKELRSFLGLASYYRTATCAAF